MNLPLNLPTPDQLATATARQQPPAPPTPEQIRSAAIVEEFRRAIHAQIALDATRGLMSAPTDAFLTGRYKTFAGDIRNADRVIDGLLR